MTQQTRSCSFKYIRQKYKYGHEKAKEPCTRVRAQVEPVSIQVTTTENKEALGSRGERGSAGGGGEFWTHTAWERDQKIDITKRWATQLKPLTDLNRATFKIKLSALYSMRRVFKNRWWPKHIEIESLWGRKQFILFVMKNNGCLSTPPHTQINNKI